MKIQREREKEGGRDGGKEGRKEGGREGGKKGRRGVGVLGREKRISILYQRQSGQRLQQSGERIHK